MGSFGLAPIAGQILPITLAVEGRLINGFCGIWQGVQSSFRSRPQERSEHQDGGITSSQRHAESFSESGPEMGEAAGPVTGQGQHGPKMIRVRFFFCGKDETRTVRKRSEQAKRNFDSD